MPAVLRENQHELLLPDGSVSIVFGTEETGYLATAYPGIESGDGATGDVQRVREDGIAFGEDYLGGKTYTFEVGVLTDRTPDPHFAVTDALDVFEGVWTDERFRERSWSYGILRSNIGGRVTRCYGRPRRYAATPGRLTHKGYVPVVADFVVADGRYYEEPEQQVTASLLAAPEGGMTAPIVFPWTTTAESMNGASLTVGGRRTTPPVIEFHGPVLNPSVQIGALKVGLNMTIEAGQMVTVDPRSWRRTVWRNDGANMAGKLTYDTPPLRKVLLTPGTHEAIYTGTDMTGTSYCRVKWMNARTRP